tara:strand:+ start:948 stop:1955 length:1008 start_codon:yes stop_codon:yes gene_type:complete
MIIDSFLFFQEINLLEIRLEYLYPVVDKFIIVEACQTFTGEIKEFNFENNIKRFSKYLDKIHYFKIKDKHLNYEELKNFLAKSKRKELNDIGALIKRHDYYDKNNLSHLLDTYHRECIKIPLIDLCKPNDLVLLSDLDEIPKFRIIESFRKDNFIKSPKVLIQHEFQFFLNNYSHSNWQGTIIIPFNLLMNNSLNLLRRNSNKIDKLKDSGYHFTSIGSLFDIKRKIKSWAHQEFNHPIIINNIESNIKNGLDIFYRIKRPTNKCINLDNNNLIDKRMVNIIKKFKRYILEEAQKDNLYKIKYLFLQIIFYSIRAIYNPKKLTGKFKKIFKSRYV